MVNVKRTAKAALLIVIMAVSVMPVQAFGHNKWTIGYEKNTNGPEKKVQGTNGWHFMYSQEVNTDGQLDASQVKECVWTDKGSCWMWYDYDEMWVPDIYASEDFDCLAANCWWRMDGNGIMDPNVEGGAVRSVIAWEAPENGTYSVNLDYTAGSMPYKWYGEDYDGGDGLTLSIHTQERMVDKVFCGAAPKGERKVIENMPAGSMSGKVTLRKGERVYVSADPGENGGADIATVKIEIIQEEGESVRSFLMTILLGGIIVIAVILVVTVIAVVRRIKSDWELEENEEDEE